MKETDRGYVILFGSILEDFLTQALLDKMVPLNADERERIFGPDQPVGSFSAKLRMAHALGIISRDARRQIDVIREMRNACAHSRFPITFDKELAGALSLLSRNRSTYKAPVDNAVARIYFCSFAMFLAYQIMGSTVDEAAKEICEDLDFIFSEAAEPAPSTDTHDER